MKFNLGNNQPQSNETIHNNRIVINPQDEKQQQILQESKQQIVLNKQHELSNGGGRALKRKEADARFENGRYEVNHNGFTAALSLTSNSRTLMSVAKGHHEVSWQLLAPENIVENLRGRMQRPNQRSEASTINTVMPESTSENEDEIFYKDAYNNIDLQYKVLDDGIKENFIVKEKKDNYEFALGLNIRNLSMRLTGNKKGIEFLSSIENNKAIFKIPMPIMYDSAGSESQDVRYEINEDGKGGYIFKIIANENWVNAAERKFPVIIDPQVIVMPNNQ